MKGELIMNVLILNASPRRKGITTSLLAEVETAISATHHTEVVRIQELRIKPCMGCLKCRPDKSCVLPRDDAHILAEKITGSDLMIIGSPVYWGNIPGTLKTFFDRNVPLFEYCEAKAIRYIPKPQLRGKKAILIVSGGSPFPYNLLQSQSRGTIRSLRTVLKAGGVKIESILNVPDSYNFEKKREHYFNKAKRIAMSIQ
jgi:NAD(P)H-dependent FMN reductase